jgi:hypothetical protein
MFLFCLKKKLSLKWLPDGGHIFYRIIVLCLLKKIQIHFNYSIQPLKFVVLVIQNIVSRLVLTQISYFNYCSFFSNFNSFLKCNMWLKSSKILKN